MGVPKFFRYISERYPCLSETVKEYQIPEFDNMYLDMNGIIHMCSHPDDNNPHFRITEERIFLDIFHYIEVLFRMIRPQKLFFMAIDGVAPRAKMNQQRGRRFRSAKDAEKLEKEAEKKKETLPTEARFDSNCITPGTVFMTKLQEQLKYFCVDKISNDLLWRNVKVILSGHETPGEGEHKIMDYIRYIRAQPGYDPNTRHCLYGLDADLIMLGLCTHEPHFSLLREEVKFGRKSTKRQSVPEEINFFLLHLSLMREYLELEFTPVKNNLVGFDYDAEKIIDDWVLMGFLVGNDFIPHLPNLHIVNGALPILYKAYMEVLPSLGGYINESGTLNLERFEKFMQTLAKFDIENFEEIRDDILYMESKTNRKYNMHSKVSTLGDLEKWSDENEPNIDLEALEPESNSRNADLDALIQATEEWDVESAEEAEEEEDDDAKAFLNFKKEYYMNKLEYSKVTPEVLRDQAEGYVRAIQWNLNYYYNGCCSWSWYYPHHYAPYISDIKGFSDFKIEFDLAKPFKPYEQLLGVLPEACKELLPTAYHHLMISEDSPLKKYYPDEFQTDKNGKRQEWEAVVLLPFMDENVLLDAMKPCNENLTPEEKERNKHGPMLIYTYTEKDLGSYASTDYFPAIMHNHSMEEKITIEDIRVPKEKLIKGAYPGVKQDIFYPGFPTMKHLKYEGRIKKARVKVFEQVSRNESMIVKIIKDDERNPEEIPVELFGKNVYVGWPHLVEARIKSMYNNKFRYFSLGDNEYNSEEVTNSNLLKLESSGVLERYKNRLGVEVGNVEILCQVEILVGRKYIFSPNGRLTLEKQYSDMTAHYPLQTIVKNIDVFDAHHSLYRDIQEVYPEGGTCFTLSNPYYGSQGLIVDSHEAKNTGRIKICVAIYEEPNFDSIELLKEEINRSYKTLYNVASPMGINHSVYSRITGSLFIETFDGEGGFKNVNAGLDLKFNKRNKETPGYTKKIGTSWYYHDRCNDLVREYIEKFPEILNYLSHTAGIEGNIQAERLFLDNWDTRVKDLQVWLRSLPTFNIEKQTCGSPITEPEVVKAIEDIVDNFKHGTKKVTMSIKPAFLYRPGIQTGNLAPDPKVEVELFDRIINIRQGFTVPFGLKGTIIAITHSTTDSNKDEHTLYDVVFDKPFKDGMELNCSPERGYRMPLNAFINISYGKRLFDQKTGKNKNTRLGSNNKSDQPWQNTNGQKFFNQLLANSSQSYQQTQKSGGALTKPIPESAFASFNTNGRQHGSSSAPTTAPNNTRKEKVQNENKEPKRSSVNNNFNDRRLVSNNLEAERKNTFAPSFMKNSNGEKSKPLAKGNTVLNQQKQCSTAIDTNFLKNLLKINSEENTNPQAQSKEILNKSSVVSTDLNVSFEMLAQKVANTPANVRLLTYYQSNNLGLPRYQYYQMENKFKAQLTLPNGEKLLGQLAGTKEEATENVANEVLQLLMKKIPSFPVPPKTWVEPSAKENLPNKDASLDAQKFSKSETLKAALKVSNDEALKTALDNPFVPTQVIKRQNSKPDRSSQDAIQKSSTKSEDVKNTVKNVAIENAAVSSQPAKKCPQRKPKKSRIAANFAIKD